MREPVTNGLGAAADRLRTLAGTEPPELAIVLGSGLGRLAASIEDPVVVPFSDIPGLPQARVEGHPGSLTAGWLAGRRVIALGGRVHMYEGHAAHDTTIAVRLAHALGARALLLSNAAGGINPLFRPGDLMLITDHINMMWRNPLVGPVHAGDTRFPDMSSPWDRGLAASLRDVALSAGISLAEGVYAGVAGPSYETPAEIRMLARLGADAVGMSTVPEVIAARAMGMRVAGVSCITNLASGLSSAPLSHDDVLASGALVAETFERLVSAWLRALPADTRD